MWLLRRIRFSLRSLLLASLTLGAATALWRHFEPWQIERDYTGATGAADRLNISPDGKWIVAEFGSADTKGQGVYRCVAWNIETGEVRTLIDEMWVKGTSETYMNSQFTKDSKWLVGGTYYGDQKIVKVWNMQNLKQTTLSPDATDRMRSIWALPDSRHLVLLREDSSSVVVNLDSGIQTGEFPGVLLGCSKSGDRVCVESLDGSLRILEMPGCRELQRIPALIDWNITSGAYLTNEHLYVHAILTETGFNDGIIDWELLHVVRIDLADPSKTNVWPGYFYNISDDESLGIISEEDSFSIVNLRTQQVLSKATALGDFKTLKWFDGDKFVFHQEHPAAFEVRTGRQIYQIPRIYRCVSPTISGSVFICLYYSDSGLINLHSLRTGTVVQEIPSKHSVLFSKDTFSSDGLKFVTQSKVAHTIHLWTRNRPEHWWGLAWLPEFWILIAFTVTLVWSLHRDRKSIHR